MSGSEQELGSTDQRIAANDKQVRNDLWMLEARKLDECLGNEAHLNK